jgi:hypothetical protein
MSRRYTPLPIVACMTVVGQLYFFTLDDLVPVFQSFHILEKR